MMIYVHLSIYVTYVYALYRSIDHLSTIIHRSIHQCPRIRHLSSNCAPNASYDELNDADERETDETTNATTERRPTIESTTTTTTTTNERRMRRNDECNERMLRPRTPTTTTTTTIHFAELDEALEAARAADRGWDRDVMEVWCAKRSSASTPARTSNASSDSVNNLHMARTAGVSRKVPIVMPSNIVAGRCSTRNLGTVVEHEPNVIQLARRHVRQTIVTAHPEAKLRRQRERRAAKCSAQLLTGGKRADHRRRVAIAVGTRLRRPRARCRFRHRRAGYCTIRRSRPPRAQFSAARSATTAAYR